MRESTLDRLARYEYLPVAGLVTAQGLYVWKWYVAALMPPQATASLPWLSVLAGVAAVIAIDGALLATIVGVRSGRRSRWSYAVIAIAVTFGALVALDLYGAVSFGAWLHAGFAALFGAYMLHLMQSREPMIAAAQYDAVCAELREVRDELAQVAQSVEVERITVRNHALPVRQLAQLVGVPEATLRYRLRQLEDN